MKRNGFTLIELMVVVVIVGIIGMILLGVVTGSTAGINTSFGINGVTETRCINGYKFVIGQSGSAQQILNDNGGGVSCK